MLGLPLTGYVVKALTLYVCSNFIMDIFCSSSHLSLVPFSKYVIKPYFQETLYSSWVSNWHQQLPFGNNTIGKGSFGAGLVSKGLIKTPCYLCRGNFPLNTAAPSGLIIRYSKMSETTWTRKHFWNLWG